MQKCNFYQYICTITLLIIYTQPTPTSIYNSLKELPKQSSGFSPFSPGIPKSCRPLYYADLNSDKFTDIICSCKTSSEQNKVSYFLYDPEEKMYVLSNNKTVTLDAKEEIYTFIANDFNKDREVDYAMTVKKDGESMYELRVYLFEQGRKEFNLSLSLPGLSSSSIFAYDFGSQRGLKILYFDPGSETRRVLLFSEIDGVFLTKNFSEFLSKNAAYCDGNHAFQNRPLSSENSNAFVDLNGDCLNDLVVTSEGRSGEKTVVNLEVWLAVKEEGEIKYCLSGKNVYELNEKFGPFSVVDVNRDTLFEMVFPVVGSSPPKIAIAYNMMKVSYEWTEDYCEKHEGISLTETSSSVSHAPQIFSSLSKLEPSEYFDVQQLSSSADYSLQKNSRLYSPLLRFGDINQDSYPDLLTLLTHKNSNKKIPFIFINTESNVNELRRNFTENPACNLPQFFDFFNWDFNVETATFFDFEENAKLDLVFFTADSKREAIGLYNHNLYDSYSLKSITLHKTNCFFCLEFGSTQRFITTNIDGTRRMDISFQAVQVGTPGVLALNFAYFGIGRSNNYIENFQIISGNSIKREYNDKTYTPVIPNSQLIVFHNNLLGTNSSTWDVDLVVKPTKNLYLLITVIVVLIVVMTMYTSYLQIKEKQEDESENKETFAPWFG